jgi:hypothetical protein
MPAFLVSLAAAILAGLVLEWVGRGARVVVRVFGTFNLTHVRAAMGALGTLALGGAINISTDDHSHHLLTYVAWYVVAGLLIVGAVVLTAIIEIAKQRAAPPPAGVPAVVAQQPSPFESYLTERIDAYVVLVSEREARGDDSYFAALVEWDRLNLWEFQLGDRGFRNQDHANSYAAHPWHAMSDGVFPPHTVEMREAYYERRVAWFRDRAQRLRDAVPDAHRAELQAIAAGMPSSIELDRPAGYHPPGQDGTPLLAASFRTHFPVLAGVLNARAPFVDSLDAARRALWLWWDAEALARDVGHAPLSLALSNIVEHTTPTNQPDGFTWKEVMGWMHVGGSAVIDIENEDVPERRSALDALLVAALASPECAELRRVRFELDAAKLRILNDLARIRAVHVIRGECQLCNP